MGRDIKVREVMTGLDGKKLEKKTRGAGKKAEGSERKTLGGW